MVQYLNRSVQQKLWSVIGHRSVSGQSSICQANPLNWWSHHVTQSGHCNLRFLLFSLSILYIFNSEIDLNINLYIYFTFLLFQTYLMSFYITKLWSDWSTVIDPSAINQLTVIDPSNSDRFKDRSNLWYWLQVNSTCNNLFSSL